jgi:hypothetical protein
VIEFARNYCLAVGQRPISGASTLAASVSVRPVLFLYQHFCVCQQANILLQLSANTAVTTGAGGVSTSLIGPAWMVDGVVAQRR